MKVYQIITLIIIAIIFSVVAVKIVEIEPKEEIKEEVVEPEYRFLPIQKWENNAVVYDTETGVQYFVMNGTMTVLVDTEGKPLLYSSEK